MGWHRPVGESDAEMRRISASHGSEVVFQSKLYDPRIARHSRSLRGAGHTAEIVRIADVQTRRAQIDVIQGIEKLRTELKLLRFREPEILRGGCVNLID